MSDGLPPGFHMQEVKCSCGCGVVMGSRLEVDEVPVTVAQVALRKVVKALERVDAGIRASRQRLLEIRQDRAIRKRGYMTHEEALKRFGISEDELR